ncbi:MAG: sugar lactone lactonase YvrE [Pirellulaceae bacterium]|jgi:sugar lactone lactonase YvrE
MLYSKRCFPSLLTLSCCLLFGGCFGESGPVVGTFEIVWGQRGVTPGSFKKPRAMAIDADDNLYIVDMTARIQVFDRDGNFIRQWNTPASYNGRPSGLTMSRDGNLLVADTHYYQMLVYTPAGELLEKRTIGGTGGNGPGEFGFVTDAIEDSKGNYYIAEYGEFDRVQKFSPAGEYLLEFGGHGKEEGKFVRPQNITIDKNDHLWVADACNHRIQIFDVSLPTPKLVRVWGEPGRELGKMRYPYDLVLDDKGHVYVCEFGNHRIQKFTLDGKSLGAWGVPGREPGEIHQPWAIVRDSAGRIHVLDTYNHRVQRIRL